MTSRATLALYGPKRGRIRVLVESGAELVRVLWREHGRRRVKSWPNTPAGRAEAKAWAQGFSESRTRPCLLYTSPSPRDLSTARMPSSA